MEEATRNLRIQTLTAQLTVCDGVCAALLKELENRDLPEGRMVTLGHRLDQASKERNGLRFMLDQLDKEEPAAKLSE